MAKKYGLLPKLAMLLVLLLLPLSVLGAQNDTVLKNGSQGPLVVALQQRLMDAGFLGGVADGKYGKATTQAVMDLQLGLIAKGHKIKADGIAGPQTLALLQDDAVMQPFLDFGLGTTGSRVLALQNRLIDLQFLDGPADGAFGEKTQQALLAFQQHIMKQAGTGVSASGIADKATRALLQPGADLVRFEIKAPEFFDDSKPLGLSAEYLNAHAAILVNPANGKILFAKSPDERVYPASTTKMMTLLLAVEKGGLDQTFVLPASTGEIPKDSSLVPVYPGESMTMQDLLYGLMVRSGNDAANAVAQQTAGSLDAFVQQMNQRAAQMKMKATQFTNPHGYHHQDHYTTARDLATLSLHLMANPQAAAIASATNYTLPATTKREALHITNSNELLNPLSQAYYPGAYGIKSGYTSQAGFCYAGMAQKDGQTLLAVILGSRTRNRGWDDMAKLFNYGFAKLER